jgi:hypothetical protein
MMNSWYLHITFVVVYVWIYGEFNRLLCANATMPDVILAKTTFWVLTELQFHRDFIEFIVFLNMQLVLILIDWIDYELSIVLQLLL